MSDAEQRIAEIVYATHANEVIRKCCFHAIRAALSDPLLVQSITDAAIAECEQYLRETAQGCVCGLRKRAAAIRQLKGKP